MSDFGYDDFIGGLADPGMGNQANNQLVTEPGLEGPLPDPGDLLSQAAEAPTDLQSALSVTSQQPEDGTGVQAVSVAPTINPTTLSNALNSLSGGGDIHPFLKTIHASFPMPEIIDLKLNDRGPLLNKTLSIKVKVSGDFLSDEWFWEDFLEYFKFKAYLVPNTDKIENESITRTSLFDDYVGYTGQIDFKREKKSLLSITDLENKSNKLENKYFFEAQIEIPEKFLTDQYEHYVVVRTYFSQPDFSKDFLNNTKNQVLDMLNNQNNGLWDAIKIEKTSNSEVVSYKRIRAYYFDKGSQEFWNGAFSFFFQNQKYYATDSIDNDVRNNFRSRQLFFMDVLFSKQDLSDELLKPVVSNLKTVDKKLDIGLNKKIQTIQIPTPNSDIYLSKEKSGDVKVLFSLDLFELIKQHSELPESLLDFVQKGLTGNTIKTFEIYDRGAATVASGRHQYSLEVKISETFRQNVETLIKRLTDSQRLLNNAFEEAKKEENYDEVTREFSRSFAETGGNGMQNDIDQVANEVYDALTTNFLADFAIGSLTLKRKRVKEEIFKKEEDQFTGEDVVLSYTTPITLFTDVISAGEIQMFSFEEVTYSPSLSYTREEFMQSYNLNNTDVEQFKNLQKNIEDFVVSLQQLTNAKDLETKNVKNQSNQNKTRQVRLDPIKFVFKNIFVPASYNEAFEYNEEVLFSGEQETIEKEEVLTFPQGVVYNFIPSATTGEQPDKKLKQLERLDEGDKKFIFSDNLGMSFENVAFNDALSKVDAKVPTATVRLEYLSGYQKNPNKENIMRSPIFLEYSESLEEGKTYLFRAKPIQKDSQFAIYNEYFIREERSRE